MAATQEALKKEVGAGQIFTLSFSAIVGVGWIVVLGDWLRDGGPMGACLAFAAAGVVMMLVGLCYSELSTMIPASGGEIAYTYEVFGLRSSFVIGWFLALMYVSATAFEAISAGWIAGILVPKLQGRALYVVRGTPVMSGSLAISLGGTLFFAALNYRGMRGSTRFQDIFTWAKIAVSMLLVGAGVLWGKVDNLRPLFTGSGNHHAAWTGSLQVFVTAPFWLAGFNTVAQVMEEKKEQTSYGRVAFALLASIAAGSVFYALLILSCSIAMPWGEIVREEFPAVAAFRAALHSEFAAKLVLFGGLLGLLATWNSIFVAASRSLFALGRARVIAPVFARVHPKYGSPTVSVAWVGALSAIGILIGRGALMPIVNMDSSCFMLMYVVVALAVISLRKTEPDRKRPYRIPGGVIIPWMAAVAAFVMLLESFYLPYTSSKGGVPLEWIIFVTWALLGLFFWSLANGVRREVSESQRRYLILGIDCRNARGVESTRGLNLPRG